jgi:hypothetical protein
VVRLEFSQIVEEKLALLRMKLVEICGEKIGKQRLAKIMSGIGKLELFPFAGIPISVVYDVEPKFEKYYMIYIGKNYFLYYIEDDVVYIVEMYDEREDMAGKFFGIHTITQETIDYWKE